jgi:hypothetical protein
MFLTAKEIDKIADDLQVNFNLNLNSQSRLPEIAATVRQHLADELDILEPRQSLCLLIAHRARLKWISSIAQVKNLNH